jgi:hypothetical protein
VQFNGRVRMDQVKGMLNYDIALIEVPKSIRESKGIVEDPSIKIEMARSSAFLVRTFGEYIGIKRKGRATQLYKPEIATGRKQKKNLKKPNLPMNPKKTKTPKMKKIITLTKFTMTKKKTSGNKRSRRQVTILILNTLIW